MRFDLSDKEGIRESSIEQLLHSGGIRESSIHQMNVSKLVSDGRGRTAWKYHEYDSVRMARKLPGVKGLEVRMVVENKRKLLKFIKNLRNLNSLHVACWQGEDKFCKQLAAVA